MPFSLFRKNLVILPHTFVTPRGNLEVIDINTLSFAKLDTDTNYVYIYGHEDSIRPIGWKQFDSYEEANACMEKLEILVNRLHTS